MSDRGDQTVSVDDLREAVINAARTWEKYQTTRHSLHLFDEPSKDLVREVRALDAALEPDPWELLRKINHNPRTLGADLDAEIEAALAWRDRKENA